MIARRDFVKAGVIGASIMATTSLSACEDADLAGRDLLGVRLKEFFETGDISSLAGVFDEDSSIVFFDGLRTKNGFGYAYLGPQGVSNALLQLYGDLTAKGFEAACKLVKSSFVGAMEDIGANKLVMRFEEPREVETSCGPAKTTRDVEIVYANGSLAVLPPLSGGEKARG